MRKYRGVSALSAFLTALCAWCLTVYAFSAPDVSRLGSITLRMQYQEAFVSGGEITLYRVGKLQADSEGYSFAESGDFSGCGMELGTLGSELSVSGQLAKGLKVYADKNNIAGMTKEIGSGGTVYFGKLETGLYLLVQKKPASGYMCAAPFLVSIPLPDEQDYYYNVTAAPKLEPEKSPGGPAPGTSGGGSPSGGSPSGDFLSGSVDTASGGGDGGGEGRETSSGPLPQTGQMNWPVPVLAVLGLGMFFAGWMLRFRRKKQNER